jgi:hypothetical protein
MKLSDIHTADYLQDFKDNYLSKVEKLHNRYESFKNLPDSEVPKAEKAQKDFQFLYSFTACVEATLEQNMALKVKFKEMQDEIDRLRSRVEMDEKHINELGKQIAK